MRFYHDINEILTLTGAAQKGARCVQESDLGLIRDGAILEDSGRIVWIGRKKDAQREMRKLTQKDPSLRKKMNRLKEVSLSVGCVLPAFTECHTHLVFAGDRRDEFEMRNQGKTYQEIAAKGGGIRSTVRATRKAKSSDLLKLAENRAKDFLRQGVTTVEIKSGYGLTERDEIKILEVASQIRSVRTIRTYLGPHAIPEGRKADEYLNEIIEKTLPKIKKKKLASRVDMFVEQNYYTLEQAKSYYDAAQKLGFRMTCHAEQLTRTGAAEWLAQLSADSVDHLVQVNDSDIQRLSRSETTCVLLPTSDFYLRMKYPPARSLIDAGARVALATDYNPGTSPTQDLSLVGVLARLEMKMSLAEVIVAYTLGAAYALNLQGQLGSLEAGKLCEFVALDGSWKDLFYQVGHHPVKKTVTSSFF